MTMRLLTMLVLACGLVAGCSAKGPGADASLAITQDVAGLKAKGKAVVVMSTGAEMADLIYTTAPPTSLYWTMRGPDGRPSIADGFIVDGKGDTPVPLVREIAAGEYILAMFSFGPYRNSGGAVGLPPAMFRVQAGDVVYLGHLRVVAEKAGLFASAKRGYTIAVQSHDAAARVLLSAKAPGLASAMQTRLATVNALVAAR